MAALRSLVVGSLIILGATVVAQQARDAAALPAATSGSASLSGTVVNEVTGRPVRRALVTLTASEGGARYTTATADDGTYTFAGLPAGRYAVGGARAGYIASAFGAARAGRPGTPVALTEGQRRAGIVLRLPPGAVITGTVRQRNGDPLPGVRVLTLREQFGVTTGERTLSPAFPAGGLGVTTDDRGMYRVFGLPADDYYVVVTAGLGLRSSTALRETTSSDVEWATSQLRGRGALSTATLPAAPVPGPAVEYAPVFYPGSHTQADAAKVTVKSGEERAGVDITFDRTPTATIRGTVTSPDGQLPAGLAVNVIAHDTIPGVPFSGFGNARLDQAGRFESAGLTPGDYTVTVRAQGQGARGGIPASTTGAVPPPSAVFGLSTVTVSGTDVEATVILRAGVTVSGRVMFQAATTSAPPEPSRVRLSLTSERSRVPSLGVTAVTPDASGAFAFVGVTPGRYRLTGAGVGAFQPRSAIANGTDALDVPIDIGDADIRDVLVTLADRSAEISGNLLDASGQPAPEYFIIVFSADQRHWLPQSRRIRSTRPGSDGGYRVPNLPAGDYLIAAVTDVEPGEWFDPTYLSQLTKASIKLTLGEGEAKAQSIKLATSR